MSIEALRKEVLAIEGHQIALGMVVSGLLTQIPAPDAERVFEVAEAYLLHASLPKEVATAARVEIRALRNTYRTS